MPRIQKEERRIVYAEVGVQLYNGDTPLTSQEAKRLIGWQVEDEQSNFGSNYDVMDREGKKVRLLNNSRNRPFDVALATTWESEVLKGHWKLNGESIILGQYGTVVSGQHRLVALILAGQAWSKEPDRWPAWPTFEPNMECLIVTGVDESDDTVNTIDTGRPRTLADVIYRSELFSNLKPFERADVATVASHAVSFIWNRVGAGKSLYNRAKRTHTDAMEFLDNHKRILACVKHVQKNNDDRKIGRWISPGYAAGMLFFMGSSSSDFDKYHTRDLPSEKGLDWSNWDRACDFWAELANGSKAFDAARSQLTPKASENGAVGTISKAERIATLAKAWQCFVSQKPITARSIALDYSTDEDGYPTLAESPTFGGIDAGDGSSEETPATPEEVEQNKVTARTAKEPKPEPVAPKKAKKNRSLATTV